MSIRAQSKFVVKQYLVFLVEHVHLVEYTQECLFLRRKRERELIHLSYFSFNEREKTKNELFSLVKTRKNIK
jgi:hypothetical protein